MTLGRRHFGTGTDLDLPLKVASQTLPFVPLDGETSSFTYRTLRLCGVVGRTSDRGRRSESNDRYTGVRLVIGRDSGPKEETLLNLIQQSYQGRSIATRRPDTKGDRTLKTQYIE